MQIARQLAQYNRRLIVYNSTNNPSYSDITDGVDVEMFVQGRWPTNGAFQVLDAGGAMFDNFLEIASRIEYNAIIIDDAGGLFNPVLTKTERAFLGTCKNNHNDVFFQFHHFKQTPPQLMMMMDMMILKETTDPMPLPTKVRDVHIVSRLLSEIRAANDTMPSDKRWHERWLNLEENIIYYPDLHGRVLAAKHYRELI